MKKILYMLVFLFSIFIINVYVQAWSEYNVGQEVEYNGIDFYVIKNSDTKEDSVTMLKAEPLTVDEVNQYGLGHVNMHVSQDDAYYQKAYDIDGYGGIQYYSSDVCGKIDSSHWKVSDCKNDYESSEIKYVVDMWSVKNIPMGLQESRLLKYDELFEQLGYDNAIWDASIWIANPEYTPEWVYGNYRYWTMSPVNDSTLYVFVVGSRGVILTREVYGREFYTKDYYLVRPVITISKSALGDIDDSESDDDKEIIPDKQEDKNSETKINVKVANTYMKTSIIIILLGFIIIEISIFVVYKVSNKKK